LAKLGEGSSLRGQVKVLTKALNSIHAGPCTAGLVRSYLQVLENLRPGSAAYWAHYCHGAGTYANVRTGLLSLGMEGGKELRKVLAEGKGTYSPVIAAGLLSELDHPKKTRSFFKSYGGSAWIFWDISRMRNSVDQGSAPLALLVEKEVCRRPPAEAKALAKAFLPLLQKGKEECESLLDHSSPAVRQVAAMYIASHQGDKKAIMLLIREGAAARCYLRSRLLHELVACRRLSTDILRQALRGKRKKREKYFCKRVLDRINNR
jgi:hypothetical protein